MEIYGTRGASGIEPIAERTQSIQPAATESNTRIADNVTLSPEARARATAASHPRFGEFSQRAHFDAGFAEEMAYAYAHLDDGPMYDMSAWGNNAIHDPELIDCVRQSAFTVDLPPPTSNGSSGFEMTIPFEGALDAGAPTSH